jgi:hypothetical protein
VPWATALSCCRTPSANKDGTIVRRFGDNPLGLFVYTADGHISIQIANPANPACVAPPRIPTCADTIVRCDAEQEKIVKLLFIFNILFSFWRSGRDSNSSDK